MVFAGRWAGPRIGGWLWEDERTTRARRRGCTTWKEAINTLTSWLGDCEVLDWLSTHVQESRCQLMQVNGHLVTS